MNDLYVFQHSFLDEFKFIWPAAVILAEDGYGHGEIESRIKKIKEIFKKYGWEGDGEIEIIWLPLDLNEKNKTGIYCWHAKQKENGISFIASPHETAIHYFDQNNDLDHQNKNRARAYWRKLLSGFIHQSVLGIKKATAVDSVEQSVFAEEKISLDVETQAAIKQFLKTHHLNLATLLQGVWGYLLSRYSGNDDIVFGSTAADPSIESLKAYWQVGLFMHTLPVRIQIQPDMTVLAYLQCLQKQLAESSCYKSSALWEIQSLSDLADSTPLFDHVFQLVNSSSISLSKITTPISPLRLIDATSYENAHYPLSIIATDAEDDICININFDVNQYFKADIQRLLGHYQEILRSLIKTPERSLIEITLLSPNERQQILYDWNKTESFYSREKLIHQLFEEQVERTPNNIALMFEGKWLTYREVNEKANQLAHYLRSLGVEQNTCVAICMEPSLELIIGIVGILKAGGAYVPLDPSYPSERLKFMLSDTHAKILITQSALANSFKKMKICVICMDGDEKKITECSLANPNHINLSEHLAYLIYTSGSTGKPKGVMITHRNVHNFIHWFSKALDIGSDDIFDFSSSISFDFSVPNTLFPIIRGAKIAICPELNKKDPNLYINHLLEKQVTFIKITPSYFRQLKEFVTSEHRFAALRYIIFGGEAIYAKDLKDWLTQFPNHKILNEYGPTETTVATSWIMLDKNTINHFKNNVSIGKPALNSQLYILDKDLQPVPIGVIGELYIGGEGVAKGYLNREDITAKKFVKNIFTDALDAKMYKTGDLCRYLADGNIEFVERLDHQVKIRGFRIETGEIENCLAAHPVIKEAVVVARDDQISQIGEKQLIAYYVPHDIQIIPSTHELRHHLHQYLPDYMVPTVFMMIKELPLSPNGKLDRKELPAPQFPEHQRYIVPRTPLEKILASIWSEVLNLKRISVDDDFFELGGNSLSAARIISKIGKLTSKEIKLHDIYEAPTIGELSNIINNAKTIDEIDTHTFQSKTDEKKIPLSEMQFLLWLTQIFYPVSKGLNIVDRRRVSARLDSKTLNYAFSCVFKKHAILSYHVSKYFPLQQAQKNINFKIIEKDIEGISEEEQEKILCESLNDLKNYHAWKKGFPLVVAKLFHLNKNVSELQICMSHIISDEVSTEILFADLSEYYAEDLNLNSYPDHIQYKDYIFEERDKLTATLNRDVFFWENYLKDTNLFLFPMKDVMNNTNSKKLSYTTYLELPEKNINRLKSFCARNRLSITDSLCAAVGLAMSDYLEDYKHNKTLVINVVKSTRNNDIYDNSIGFFVRTDLIKMNLNDSPNFVELSKRVQKSVSETAPYQFCTVIVKLACLFKRHWENKKISDFLIKLGVIFCTKLFHRLQFNKSILMMYGRMLLIGPRKNFLVDVNIFNNFITYNNYKNTEMFGSKLEQVTDRQNDRMIAKNILEICFYRDSHNKAYLMLSGNLKPALREQIGKDIIKNMDPT